MSDRRKANPTGGKKTKGRSSPRPRPGQSRLRHKKSRRGKPCTKTSKISRRRNETNVKTFYKHQLDQMNSLLRFFVKEPVETVEAGTEEDTGLEATRIVDEGRSNPKLNTDKTQVGRTDERQKHKNDPNPGSLVEMPTGAPPLSISKKTGESDLVFLIRGKEATFRYLEDLGAVVPINSSSKDRAWAEHPILGNSQLQTFCKYFSLWEEVVISASFDSSVHDGIRKGAWSKFGDALRDFVLRSEWVETQSQFRFYPEPFNLAST